MTKVIIIGNAHHNTLGLVRSLGEKGIRPILLLEPCDLRFCCVRFSRYIAKIHYLKSVEDVWNCVEGKRLNVVDVHKDTLEWPHKIVGDIVKAAWRKLSGRL